MWRSGLVALSVGLAVTGCGRVSAVAMAVKAGPRVPAAEVPNIRDVVSMEASSGTPPGTQRRTIRDVCMDLQVLGWLAKATEVGGKPTPVRRGYWPAVSMRLRDGGLVWFVPAVACSVHRYANGSTDIACRAIAGEVDYRRSRVDKPIRLYAPELYGWLMGAWK